MATDPQATTPRVSPDHRVTPPAGWTSGLRDAIQMARDGRHEDFAAAIQRIIASWRSRTNQAVPSTVMDRISRARSMAMEFRTRQRESRSTREAGTPEVPGSVRPARPRPERSNAGAQRTGAERASYVRALNSARKARSSTPSTPAGMPSGSNSSTTRQSGSSRSGDVVRGQRVYKRT